MTPTPQQSATSQDSPTAIDPLLSYELFKHEWQLLESNCCKLHKHFMANIEFISQYAAITRVKSRTQRFSKKIQNTELKKALVEITMDALKHKKRGPWRLPEYHQKYLYDLIRQIIKNKEQLELFLQNLSAKHLAELRLKSVTSQLYPVTVRRKPKSGRVPTVALGLLFENIRKCGLVKRGIRL